MEPEQTQQEQEVAVDARRSVWNTVTPFSKYFAMALFIILPFVGGYVGYVVVPEKVVERESVKEPEVEKGAEVQVSSEVIREEMFSISNVQIAPVVTMGEAVAVTWDFESGTDPDNAYLYFQLESAAGVVLNYRLRGAGSPGLYKQGRADIGIPVVCSEVPAEGCIDDDTFDADANFVLKVTGRSCADGETSPGYCEYYGTELVETQAVYSNEFILEYTNKQSESQDSYASSSTEVVLEQKSNEIENTESLPLASCDRFIYSSLPKTYIQFSDGYQKVVCHQTKQIVGADPETWHPLEFKGDHTLAVGGKYFVEDTTLGFDKENLYIGSEIFMPITRRYPDDATNIEYVVIEEKVFMVQRTGLGSYTLSLISLDAESFTYLGSGYGHDHEAIYTQNYRHGGSPTIKPVLNPSVIADTALLVNGEKVYYGSSELEGLDLYQLEVGESESFRTGYFVRDSGTVYIFNGNCHGGGTYELGTVSDIENYVAPC